MDDTRRALHGGAATADVAPPDVWPPLPRLGGQSGPYLRFPGCRPVPLSRDRLDDFDEKIEYWDAWTEVAWVAETPGALHAGPHARFVEVARCIALVRGTPIVTFVNMGLVQRDATGAPVQQMQPDGLAYLHPDRANLPVRTVNVGEHDLPDVVLEVDHTTDVRAGKLRAYERWGIPELWVVVPHETSRPPVGATVHVLEGGRYRSAASSVAFPGLTAAEILVAHTEPLPSAQTERALERVGRVLGAQSGTRPEDSALIHSLTRSSNRQAYAAGRTAGHAEGHSAGRAAELVANVQGVLAARGIRLTEPLPSGPAPFSGVSSDTVMAAAVACADEADFWRRLGLPRG